MSRWSGRERRAGRRADGRRASSRPRPPRRRRLGLGGRAGRGRAPAGRRRLAGVAGAGLVILVIALLVAAFAGCHRPARLRRPGPGLRAPAAGLGGGHVGQPARHRPARPRRAEPGDLRRAHLAPARPGLGAAGRRHRRDARAGQRLGRRPRGRGHHEHGGGAALAALPALRHRVHGAAGLELHEPRDRAGAAQLGGLRPAGAGLGAVDEDARVRHGGGGPRRARHAASSSATSPPT